MAACPPLCNQQESLPQDDISNKALNPAKETQTSLAPEDRDQGWPISSVCLQRRDDESCLGHNEQRVTRERANFDKSQHADGFLFGHPHLPQS
nr:hypothetical protein L204_02850 [Cryptococcus depauperatus CBS 7855]